MGIGVQPRMFEYSNTPATGKWLKTGLTGMVTIVRKRRLGFWTEERSGATSDLTFIGIQSKDSMDIQKAIDDA